MSDNKVAEMLSEVSGNFKGMIDANSVVGEPITAGDGTIIVPISKVSFGFGGGGSEFEGKNTADTRFGGGMGGGASVKAEAFLVINNGNVRLISMGGETSPLDKIVDLVPGIIDKVNGFIAGRSEKKANKKEPSGEKEPEDDNN
ncbi:MAG: sporulation protein YtfJ [Firmicutes bacterium]|nr:sporulation protein YtfJ [Bacillota bacterium]